MKIRTFNYTVEGTANGGQTWTTSGAVQITNEAIDTTMHLILRDSFDQLTRGKAIYGLPGVGCKGPYDIYKIVIEQVKQ